MIEKSREQFSFCQKLKISNPYIFVILYNPYIIFDISNLLLFNLTEFIIWHIWGLLSRVVEKKGFKNQSLWQKLIYSLQVMWYIRRTCDNNTALQLNVFLFKWYGRLQIIIRIIMFINYQLNLLKMKIKIQILIGANLSYSGFSVILSFSNWLRFW